MTYNEKHQRQHVKMGRELDCDLWAQDEILVLPVSFLYKLGRS